MLKVGLIEFYIVTGFSIGPRVFRLRQTYPKIYFNSAGKAQIAAYTYM